MACATSAACYQDDGHENLGVSIAAVKGYTGAKNVEREAGASTDEDWFSSYHDYEEHLKF